MENKLILFLERFAFKENYTIGNLYINSKFFCNTLEDTDRYLNSEMGKAEIEYNKIMGKTAIPTGVYPIEMDTASLTFKNRDWAKPYEGKIPRLMNVKGFNGILIHPGNDENDTSGCILVGKNRAVGKVLDSQVTFKKLMNDYLIPAKNNNTTIEIVVYRKY